MYNSKKDLIFLNIFMSGHIDTNKQFLLEKEDRKWRSLLENNLFCGILYILVAVEMCMRIFYFIW